MLYENLMNYNYKLSESEVVTAMKIHGKASKLILGVLCSVAVVFILIGIFTKYKFLGFGSVLGGVIGYFSALMLVIPFYAKRHFKQNKALKNEISVQFSEQGINFKGESGESTLQWSYIHKWKYDKGIYLLYITNNMFHIIPQRALTNESNLDTLLNKHLGSKKP